MSASAWTGGQYSLFRFVLGMYLVVHFATLLPYGTELFSNAGVLPDGRLSPYASFFPNPLLVFDDPAVVTGALVAGIGCAFLLAVGLADRLASIALFVIWASLFGRNPLITNPGLPYVGLLLLIHAGTPRGPYGAWSVRGRPDPAGEWNLPTDLWRVGWTLMAVGYLYSGYSKVIDPAWRDGSALQRVLNDPAVGPNPLGELFLSYPSALEYATWAALAFQLAFAFLVISRRLRPLAWGAMLLLHLGLFVAVGFVDVSFGLVLLHLFTFDPGWLPPRRGEKPMRLYYDGECGLCHRTVRLALAEDADGQTFRFAPLQGETFERNVPEDVRAGLPDSLVLELPDGSLATRSTAVARILIALGGYWRALGHVLSWFPRPLRDQAYALVAAVRKRVFPRPEGLCPVLPARLGVRFEG